MKRPPLYHTVAQQPPKLNGGHAGLWFDKFCHGWREHSERGKREPWSLKSSAEENPKLDWIKTVASKPVGDAELLAIHTERLNDLVRALGGQALHFTTASRFATGLGREHPIENGFVWHPALGVPCLPGSSVKGLVRAWVAAWLEADTDEVARIFGPRDLRQAPATTGTVIFFDALPLKPVRLAADVMTPHYGPYYERGEVPGDWVSPVPIPFLTVASGETFVFSLATRTRSPQDLADCVTASGWLETALLEIGAGAKTAVGYGRLVRDTASELRAEGERKAAQQRAADAAREAEAKAALATKLANLSPLALELEQAAQAGRWDTDKNAFTQAGTVESWLDRLEADPQPDAAQRLRELLDRHFPGLLANPDKTEGKKNKPTYKDRWRNIAKRLNALPKLAP